MKKLATKLSIAVLASISISAAAHAASQSVKMTCSDFIQLDEVSRPKVVYFIDGFDRKGNLSEETIDFDRNDRLVPVLVEECTKAPTSLLTKKIKVVQKKTASN